jgi:hypothetical protein
MALDFPASPSVGQTYSGPSGVIWSFDGAKWINGTGVVAYAPIASPVFTGDPRGPTPTAGDNATSLATTAFVAPAFNGIGRNLLHNPLFNVAQRGAGPFSTLGAYTSDRWQLGGVLDAATISAIVASDADRAAIGDEAAAVNLSIGVTGNASATAFSYMQQKIEKVQRLSGKTVTVSFWARTLTTLKLGVSFTQSFGTTGSPSAAVNTNGQAVQLTTSWARYSVTATVPSASGKTYGTDGNDYTALNLWLSSGANNASLAGSIGVQSGTIVLWGVQLEIGSLATPLEKPDPRYDLSNCQRFYSTGIIQYYGYSAGGITVAASTALPVQMRAAPTVVPTFTNVNVNGPGAVSVAAGYVNAFGSPPAAGLFQLQSVFTASADL